VCESLAVAVLFLLNEAWCSLRLSLSPHRANVAVCARMPLLALSVVGVADVRASVVGLDRGNDTHLGHSEIDP